MINYLLIALLITPHAFGIDWQGHRGARGLYPENTIGAMLEALKYPITTLELDVVISKDKQVIVSHEPWMSEEICLDPHGKKIEGKKHNLYQLSQEEIVKYDCGSIPHPRFPKQQKVSVGRPSLGKLLEVTEEALKNLNRTNVQYNIEIKSTPEDEKSGYQPGIPEFSELVIKTILEKIPVSRFVIQSFDWRVLKYVHQKYPEIKLSALYEGEIAPAVLIFELGFNPSIYSPHYLALKKEHVEGYHKSGIKVIPWTVNDAQVMHSLLEMGVDGIITDYPDLISEVISKKCKNGFNHFDGKCIKIPRHAKPSLESPGWICKSGYVQKRSKSCQKLAIPKHGHLQEDGKTWECDPGYGPYRGSCVKK